MREPKRLTRVTQNEISLDVGGIVYWKTERLKKAEKNTSRVLVPFAGRGVLDSLFPLTFSRNYIIELQKVSSREYRFQQYCFCKIVLSRVSRV